VTVPGTPAIILVMSFTSDMKERSAAEYADFLLPHLDTQMVVLDAGCGTGTLSIGLAEHCASVVAFDNTDAFADAAQYCRQKRLDNIRFEHGDVYRLDFPDECFDACLCHSVLETLARPLDALAEISRVCKRGAPVGVASVEYDGIILAGDRLGLLERFYSTREQLWVAQEIADPYMGRNLRGLLNQAGFKDVVATTKSFCYGTPTAIREFGLSRASDCEDDWYAGSALASGLATKNDLQDMKRAWEAWSRDPGAYLAFPWCRAVGWKA